MPKTKHKIWPREYRAAPRKIIMWRVTTKKRPGKNEAESSVVCDSSSIKIDDPIAVVKHLMFTVGKVRISQRIDDKSCLVVDDENTYLVTRLNDNQYFSWAVKNGWGGFSSTKKKMIAAILRCKVSKTCVLKELESCSWELAFTVGIIVDQYDESFFKLD